MRRDTKHLSLGAMLSVLTIILLYSTTIFTTIKLTILALSSVLVAIAVMETGRRTAILVYISSTMLGLLFVPNKSVVLGYALFAGCYPILKHIIEEKRILLLEWLIKLIVFNGMLVLSYSLLAQFLSIDVELAMPLAGAWMLAQVAFAIYDVTLTAVIGYYTDQIRCKLFKRL